MYNTRLKHFALTAQVTYDLEGSTVITAQN